MVGDLLAGVLAGLVGRRTAGAQPDDQCARECEGFPPGPDRGECESRCRRFRGSCPSGANLCSDDRLSGCNGSRACACCVSTGGDTVCADNSALEAGSSCGDCGSSDECARLLPDVPGVFCVRPSPPG